MGDSADFARAKLKAKRAKPAPPRRVSDGRDTAKRKTEIRQTVDRILSQPKPKKKEGLLSRIVHAPAHAVDSLIQTPFERRPTGGAAGAQAATKVIGKATEGAIKGYAAGYDPREYVKMGKGALQGNRFDQAALAMSVIPVLPYKPGRFIKAAEILDHSPERSVQNLRHFESDPRGYARALDENAHDAQWGYTDDYSKIGKHAQIAVDSLDRAGSLPRVKKIAQQLADKLESAPRPKAGEHPAHMTPAEFAVSDYPVWHSTTSAPGLGKSLHAGTLTAAFDRFLAKSAGGRVGPKDQPRFIPLAIRGKKPGLLHNDPGTDVPLPHASQSSFKHLDPRQMVDRRREAYGDTSQYINYFEDPGEISVQFTNPNNARSHLDLIRDYIATYGEIPRGLEGYRFPDVMLAHLRKQIEASQQATKGGLRPIFSDKAAKRNAFLSAFNYGK